MQETKETWVGPLGREDPLEEGMATHVSVLAWRVPWAGGPGGRSPEHQSQTHLKQLGIAHGGRGLQESLK